VIFFLHLERIKTIAGAWSRSLFLFLPPPSQPSSQAPTRSPQVTTRIFSFENFKPRGARGESGGERKRRLKKKGLRAALTQPWASGSQRAAPALRGGEDGAKRKATGGHGQGLPVLLVEQWCSAPQRVLAMGRSVPCRGLPWAGAGTAGTESQPCPAR